MRTQDHLQGLTHAARDVAAVDSMQHGVFVVGPSSTVIHLNRAAEDIVAVGDGPRVRWGRLGVEPPHVDARLQQCIAIDPERRAEPRRDLLMRLYGLTRAEADVALRVIRGDGLRPISDDMALSMATVKTHLQRVFVKTGTHRQAELVRVLLAITL